MSLTCSETLGGSCFLPPSATFCLGIPHPLPCLLFWSPFPRHCPGSSSASLLIVLSLKPDVWVFHTEHSPFPAMAIKVLVIHFSAQRPLCSWSLSRSSPSSAILSLIGLPCGENKAAWLGFKSCPFAYLRSDMGGAALRVWGRGSLTPKTQYS